MNIDCILCISTLNGHSKFKLLSYVFLHSNRSGFRVLPIIDEVTEVTTQGMHQYCGVFCVFPPSGLSPPPSRSCSCCYQCTVLILINATTLMFKSTLSTNNFGNYHFGPKYQKQNILRIFRRL